MSAKTRLTDVTLVIVDDLEPNRAAATLSHCLNLVEPNMAILVTSSGVVTTSESSIKICRPPYIIDSGIAYSMFMLRHLHEIIPTHCALVMQNDGFILNPLAWTDSLLDWDYIGAPWKLSPYHDWPPFPPVTKSTCVGNGGFSLRSVPLMRMVASLFQAPKYRQPRYAHPEDCFIVREVGPLLQTIGYKFAPVDVARRFSCENELYQGSFGFHGKETMRMNNIELVQLPTMEV